MEKRKNAFMKLLNLVCFLCAGIDNVDEYGINFPVRVYDNVEKKQAPGFGRYRVSIYELDPFQFTYGCAGSFVAENVEVVEDTKEEATVIFPNGKLLENYLRPNKVYRIMFRGSLSYEGDRTFVCYPIYFDEKGKFEMFISGGTKHFELLLYTHIVVEWSLLISEEHTRKPSCLRCLKELILKSPGDHRDMSRLKYGLEDLLEVILEISKVANKADLSSEAFNNWEVFIKNPEKSFLASDVLLSHKDIVNGTLIWLKTIFKFSPEEKNLVKFFSRRSLKKSEVCFIIENILPKIADPVTCETKKVY